MIGVRLQIAWEHDKNLDEKDPAFERIVILCEVILDEVEQDMSAYAETVSRVSFSQHAFDFKKKKYILLSSTLFLFSLSFFTFSFLFLSWLFNVVLFCMSIVFLCRVIIALLITIIYVIGEL